MSIKIFLFRTFQAEVGVQSLPPFKKYVNCWNFAWPYIILSSYDISSFRNTHFGTLFPTVAIDFCFFTYFHIFALAIKICLFSII